LLLKPTGLPQRSQNNPTHPAHPAQIQHPQALTLPYPASGAPGATG
jgi:hypothetical protein